MGLFVLVFLYGALSFLVTEIFVQLRFSLSYFSFDILRTAGYRWAPLLWPMYALTITLNPGMFRETFRCAIVWWVFGYSIMRVLLPPESVCIEVFMVFVVGSAALVGISYGICFMLDTINMYR